MPLFSYPSGVNLVHYSLFIDEHNEFSNNYGSDALFAEIDSLAESTRTLEGESYSFVFFLILDEGDVLFSYISTPILKAGEISSLYISTPILDEGEISYSYISTPILHEYMKIPIVALLATTACLLQNQFYRDVSKQYTLYLVLPMLTVIQ